MKKSVYVTTVFLILLVAAIASSQVGRQLLIDNLVLDGNTVSSTNTNGDVNISPNGSGSVVVNTDLDVDNINLNGNSLTSTNSNGDISISPNGTGTVVINTDLDVDNLNFNGNIISNTSTGGIIIDPAGSQDFVLNDLTASRVLVLDSSKAVQSSVITSTELGYLDDVTSALCGINQSCTLTNKTLTSPVLNTGISGTAILDEDDMVSDSATQLATQQSIKAYVDANAGGGGGSSAYRAVTTTDNVGTSDETMKLSGASFTSTLPTAVGVEGKRYKFIHAGTSFSQVYTLATTSSQTIGGVAGGSYALHTNGEALSIESDGANWIITNHKTDTGWFSVTVAGSWSTNTTYSALMKRVGDTAFYRISVATSGAPTSANLTITLNNSLIIDTAKMAIAASSVPLGVAVTYDASTAKYFPSIARYNSTTNVQIFYINNTAPSQYTAVSNADPMSFASGDSVNFDLAVPITGWQP